MAGSVPTMFDTAFADDTFSDGPWANAWQPVWDDPPAGVAATTNDTPGFGTPTDAPAQPHDMMGDYGNA